MTSYPKTISKFVPWTKAMVAGATVDKPDYGKMTGTNHRNKLQRAKRKKRKRHNAKKD